MEKGIDTVEDLNHSLDIKSKFSHFISEIHNLGSKKTSEDIYLIAARYGLFDKEELQMIFPTEKRKDISEYHTETKPISIKQKRYDFAAWLREVMNCKNMTATHLAKKTNCHSSTIAGIQLARRSPGTNLLKKIENALRERYIPDEAGKNTNNKDITIIPTRAEKRIYGSLKTLLHYICPTPGAISSASKELGIKPAAYGVAFTAVMGIPPIQYLKKLRTMISENVPLETLCSQFRIPNIDYLVIASEKYRRIAPKKRHRGRQPKIGSEQKEAIYTLLERGEYTKNAISERLAIEFDVSKGTILKYIKSYIPRNISSTQSGKPTEPVHRQIKKTNASAPKQSPVLSGEERPEVTMITSPSPDLVARLRAVRTQTEKLKPAVKNHEPEPADRYERTMGRLAKYCADIIPEKAATDKVSMFLGNMKLELTKGLNILPEHVVKEINRLDESERHYLIKNYEYFKKQVYLKRTKL